MVFTWVFPTPVVSAVVTPIAETTQEKPPGCGPLHQLGLHCGGFQLWCSERGGVDVMAVSSLGTPWVAGQSGLGGALGCPQACEFWPRRCLQVLWGGIWLCSPPVLEPDLCPCVPWDTPCGTSPLCRQTSASLPGSLMGAAKSTRAGVWMGLWAWLGLGGLHPVLRRAVRVLEVSLLCSH